MDWGELENGLSWFAAAPARWARSAKKDLTAAAEWILVVLEGDFAEETSIGQATVGTVIGMIPLVGQITDVRDIVANSLKIKQDKSNLWAWFALVLCLIALFPTLGGFVKGCFKVLFAYGRKGAFAVGKVAFDHGLWKVTEAYVEAGIRKLNDFLARPEVRKAMEKLKIDNPYKYLSELLTKLSGTVTVARLGQAFDSGLDVIKSLLGMVKKWGTAAMQTKAGQLLEDLNDVRKAFDEKIGEVLKPAQDWLNKLAQRLDVEWRVKYKADVNAPNPHGDIRVSLDSEIEAIKKAPPEWITVAKEGQFPALKTPPHIPPTHADISAGIGGPLDSAFNTFHGNVEAAILPPGTKIYRVLAPKSYDNSICWMSEAEFKKLRGKTDWRKRFAVWMNWNVNGEYLTYTVPKGPGLPVWRGQAASQQLTKRGGDVIKADAKGASYWLEGGAEQIVVNPADLKKEYASARQPTGWGYDEGDVKVGLVGVPILETNWR